MTEWTVVSVLVVLTGLGVSLVKPLLALNGALTRLTDAVGVLERELANISAHNDESHARIWEQERLHDRELRDHEKRILLLEERE
ncbi:MAG: hypothetical protein E7472_07695 [Ruminococcaceae bacterium]|nr:hypothetical protein [Oscillospiraceae bacterium]